MSSDTPSNLAGRYENILRRIEGASVRSGRSPDAVTLVAISKNFSADRIRQLYELGQRDFGENKVQELVQKREQLAASGPYEDIVWHFVGHLQRNKVKNVLGTFDLFHGLDSERLADEMNRRAGERGENVHCLVQVNISEEQSKHGIDQAEVAPFVHSLSSREHLLIEGLMGMARPDAVDAELHAEFGLLRELRDQINSGSDNQAGFNSLSMGMSQDFETAISQGATYVRIGSAIFGERVVIRP